MRRALRDTVERAAAVPDRREFLGSCASGKKWASSNSGSTVACLRRCSPRSNVDGSCPRCRPCFGSRSSSASAWSTSLATRRVRSRSRSCGRKIDSVFRSARASRTLPYWFESLDFPAVDRRMNSYFVEFAEVPTDWVKRHHHPGAEMIYILSGVSCSLSTTRSTASPSATRCTSIRRRPTHTAGRGALCIARCCHRLTGLAACGFTGSTICVTELPRPDTDGQKPSPRTSTENTDKTRSGWPGRALPGPASALRRDANTRDTPGARVRPSGRVRRAQRSRPSCCPLRIRIGVRPVWFRNPWQFVRAPREEESSRRSRNRRAESSLVS